MKIATDFPDYSEQWSVVTPGLLIFLTDESEKSVELVNRLVDEVGVRNHTGMGVKNRCFIIICNYSGIVKTTGWLHDLYETPLKIVERKVRCLDGNGGWFEQMCSLPIWVEAKDATIVDYDNASLLIYNLTTKWISDNPNNPVPIIIDIYDSSFCGKIDRTPLSKANAISCQDGKVLLFGCDLSKEFIDSCPNVFVDNVPEQWIHRSYYMKEGLRREGIMRAEDLAEIIRLQHVGGQPVFEIINGKHVGWWESNNFLE